MLELRESHADLIYKAVDEAVADGSPINRPLWWEDPDDPATFTIDDEYMLGGDILVAPVVHEGADSRDIYLPRGNWVGHNGIVHVGPTTLVDYPAPLNVLPYFVKVGTN